MSQITSGVRVCLDWLEAHPDVKVMYVSVGGYEDPGIQVSMTVFRELFAGQQVRRLIHGDSAHYLINVNGITFKGVELARLAEQQVHL
jgi:hypothetical protein